jgi:hypothetical protein
MNWTLHAPTRSRIEDRRDAKGSHKFTRDKKPRLNLFHHWPSIALHEPNSMTLGFWNLVVGEKSP